MADSAGRYSAELNYLSEITADEIVVVFNGTTYTVPKRTRTLPNSDVHIYYGTLGLAVEKARDATGEYPFCIYVAQGLNTVYVSTDVYENHNPFTIKIVAEGVTTTPCFDKARGYSCGEEIVTLTEESVTTIDDGGASPWGELSYSQLIDADAIKVTFNGTEYECERTDLDGDNNYGAPFDPSTNTYDWSEYPFNIWSGDDATFINTSTAGTYTIKIEGMQEVVTTTQCFEKAVQSIASPLVVEAAPAPYEATSASPSYLNAFGNEIMEAMTTRGAVVRDPYGAVYSVLSVSGGIVTIGNGLYHSTTQQTEFKTYAYEEGSDGLRYPPEGFQ